jgi:hypothetical protein
MSEDPALAAFMANTDSNLRVAAVMATFIWASVIASMSRKERDLQSAQGMHFKSEIFANQNLTAFCEKTADEQPYSSIELTEKFLQSAQAHESLRLQTQEYARSIFKQFFCKLSDEHVAEIVNVYKACNAPLLMQFAHK